MLLLSACQPPEQARVQVQTDLQMCLLNVTDLPVGWQIASAPGPYDLPERILPGRALAGVRVTFLYPEFGARAFHELLLYNDPEQAAREFARQQPGVFYRSGRITPWEEPDIVYTNRSADRFRLACADFETGGKYNRICAALAQYDRFLSAFDTWISPEYMTHEQLIQALQAIDRQMTQCVERIQ
ncbi:MAG: hypothetical protein D6694_15785 [Gammaproteobacteria bacterium]|nr:MAG: hypothetical protein D6694_15785 [Gammaproteobacteria bacterium]